MTGKHPARLHMTIWYEQSKRAVRNRRAGPARSTVGDLPLTEVTLAEALEAGRLPDGRSSASGTWAMRRTTPRPRASTSTSAARFWGAPPTYFYPYRGPWNNGDEIPLRTRPPECGKPGEYLTDRLTDEALRIIDAAGDRPFFLYLAHHAVHTPIEAKPELVEHYRAEAHPTACTTGTRPTPRWSTAWTRTSAGCSTDLDSAGPGRRDARHLPLRQRRLHRPVRRPGRHQQRSPCVPARVRSTRAASASR